MTTEEKPTTDGEAAKSPKTGDGVMPGDLVRFVGSGGSVLDLGPGRVVLVGVSTVLVRVLHGGVVTGRNKIRKGEEFWFSAKSLERVEGARP